MIADDLAGRQLAIYAELVELGKTDPAAVDRHVTAMVSHLRSWRPESIMPLAFGPPTDPAEVAELFRAGFAALEKLDPNDVDRLVGAIAGHLRQLRPEQLGAMGQWPEPSEVIRDPRKG